MVFPGYAGEPLGAHGGASGSFGVLLGDSGVLLRGLGCFLERLGDEMVPNGTQTKENLRKSRKSTVLDTTT